MVSTIIRMRGSPRMAAYQYWEFLFFLAGHYSVHTYGVISSTRRNLFRHQDDIEGIRLYLREAGESRDMPFLRILRAPLQRCVVIEVETSSQLAGPTQPTGMIAPEKQAKLGFPTAARGHRRLGMTAETRNMQSWGAAVPIRACSHHRRGRKRPPVCVFCSVIL